MIVFWVLVVLVGGQGGGGGHPAVHQTPLQVVYGKIVGVQITEAKVLVAV